MVFLHGGGHQSGANIQYPGHFLADRDVVIVVPNYRLNIFGKGHVCEVKGVFADSMPSIFTHQGSFFSKNVRPYKNKFQYL